MCSINGILYHDRARLVDEAVLERMRCLYWAEKVRRRASATTSGLGRGGVAGSAATVLPAPALRSASLRSASLRSATGKTVGRAEEIPLFLISIPILALLSNYDRGICLINVGTEGATGDEGLRL